VLLSVLLWLGGAGLVVGCGDDESDCKPPVVIDVRNGSWEITEVIEFSGTDTTCFDSTIVDPDTVIVETYQDTVLYCEFHEWGDPTDTELCCDNVLEGNEVDISCRQAFPLDVCQLVFEVTATGTVTDTSFNLDLRFLDTLAGPRNPCEFFEGYQDTCFTVIHSTGRWISADGDTACLSAARTGEDLMRSVIARARNRFSR
jgi:hypothetical protein